MIRHLCALQNAHHKSSYHLSPYRVNTVLPIIVPMLCLTSLWFINTPLFPGFHSRSVCPNLSLSVPLFLGFLESLPGMFLILLYLSLCISAFLCVSLSDYLKKKSHFLSKSDMASDSFSESLTKPLSISLGLCYVDWLLYLHLKTSLLLLLFYKPKGWDLPICPQQAWRYGPCV